MKRLSINTIKEKLSPTVEPFTPRIAVVADDSKIQAAMDEFYNALGMACFGMRICSIEEAVEQKLPLRQAQQDFADGIPNNVFICQGVDELIPEEYVDPEIQVHLDSVVFKSDKDESSVDIGIHKQNNKDNCACGSGKIFKKCCKVKKR